MKRVSKLTTSIFTGIGIFLQAQAAHAAPGDLCPPGDFANLCKLDVAKGGNSIVGTIVQFLLIIAVVLALMYLVYGGIRYITSGGDKAKVDAARSHITAAVVGLILAFAAYLIVNVVAYVFGVNITKLAIPKLVP